MGSNGTVRSTTLCLLCAVVWAGCASDPQKPQVTPRAVAQSPEELIQDLGKAYFSMDLEWFSSLLAHGVDAPTYVFVTDAFANLPQDSWTYDEEVLLHQRMFQPGQTPTGQTPVPAELWPRSITGVLTAETAFTERTDLYTPGNPDGLSPDRWKVMDAIYGTDVLWDLQGDIDYAINGRALFIVIEDLEKEPGAADRFLLWQWTDLANLAKSAAVEGRSWTGVKSLYN